jgi:hypothetical protein
MQQYVLFIGVVSFVLRRLARGRVEMTFRLGFADGFREEAWFVNSQWPKP